MKIQLQRGHHCLKYKYVIFFCEIDYIDPARFGNREIEDPMPHEFQWIREGERVRYHPRLWKDWENILNDFHRYL